MIVASSEMEVICCHQREMEMAGVKVYVYLTPRQLWMKRRDEDELS